MMQICVYRTKSRCPWSLTNNANTPTEQQLQIGAILRIADAVELIAKPHVDAARLQKRLDDALAEEERWHSAHERRAQERDHLERRIRSLRGVITRERKQRGGEA